MFALNKIKMNLNHFSAYSPSQIQEASLFMKALTPWGEWPVTLEEPQGHQVLFREISSLHSSRLNIDPIKLLVPPRWQDSINIVFNGAQHNLTCQYLEGTPGPPWFVSTP